MKYSLGLDIGVTSVGWAVIDENNMRIHDLGVRIFEKAEDPQSGDSLAKPRRDARSARRRLRRRRQRLNTLKNLFIRKALLDKDKIEKLLSRPNDPYEIRTRALNEKISNEDLFIALYHIAKRRGYKSNRKSEEDKSEEGGRVIQAIANNKLLLSGNSYRTAGEALLNDEKYKAHKRNKHDDYTNSFARADFLHEIEIILAKQKSFGLELSDADIHALLYNREIQDLPDGTKNEIFNGAFAQRPFITPELIESMVGVCTFEDGLNGTTKEKRAPRSSYSFEVFRLASDLTHVNFVLKSSDYKNKARSSITLSSSQIQKIIEEAKCVKEITYKKVKQLAGIGGDYRFDYVRGKIAADDEFGEKNVFGSLKAYYSIKKALESLPDDWVKVNDEDTLNQIAYILTVQKSDDGLQKAFDLLEISDSAKESLIKILPTNFKTFGHLSVKSLKKITPHIIDGNTYDKACELVGYDFRQKNASLHDITNPVVKRAISQTLKVVRAIDLKYGHPYYIKIETSRDLAKNFRDRKNIEIENKENQVKNNMIVEKLKEFGVASPNGQQIIKFKLYNEQNGRTLYGSRIDIKALLTDDTAYQVDHIIPFSRSGNDGIANKTLVTAAENQQKSNKTPYEYIFSIDNSGSMWKDYVARVEATYITKQVKDEAGKQKLASKDKRDNYKYNGYAFKKKANLLTEDYKPQGWNIRALNDTRYITRFVQNYIKNTVQFADGDDKKRVINSNGVMTSYLRKRWGLNKNRQENVFHHSVDAAIVATLSDKLIMKVNLAAKKTEIRTYLNNAKTVQEKTDLLTGEIMDESGFDEAQKAKLAHEIQYSKHFPEPWGGFSKEVLKRTLDIDKETLQNELRGLDNYDDEFRLQVKPVFVSRMPNRKASGAAHKETLRSPKVSDGNRRTVRKRLVDINLKDLDNSVLVESDAVLYGQLKKLLEANDDDPKKAFSMPVYKNGKKVDKNNKPLSPVSAIKVYSTEPSGFFINQGRAFVNNGSMVRLDVYQKANKKGKIEHFFVPVYTHQIKGKLPTKILPEPKGFTDIDDTFAKITTLYPNDYVRVYFGNKIEEGYYVMYGVAAGQMVLIKHSSADKSRENLRSISPRSAVSIERYDVSILGDNVPRV